MDEAGGLEASDKEGKRAYEEDINGFLATHVRLLDLFDLPNKTVQPLGNLLL